MALLNLVSRAMETHRRRLKTTNGFAAHYKRGAIRTPVTVVWGSTVFDDATGDNGFQGQFKGVDALVDPTELVIRGEASEPQRGDVIETETERFELMPGLSGSAWEWSDGTKTFYRVHLKRVERVED